MNVEHDRERRQFVVRTPEGEGQLVYREPREGVVDLTHTHVDRALRGQGVAEALAEAAFDFAREQGLRVVPSCSFVKGWVEKNPDQQDILE
jgi:predicted GNAT family acetyltransferase